MLQSLLNENVETVLPYRFGAHLILRKNIIFPDFTSDEILLNNLEIIEIMHIS